MRSSSANRRPWRGHVICTDQSEAENPRLFMAENKKWQNVNTLWQWKSGTGNPAMTNQRPDILILTNQSAANEWKFPKSNQSALIVLLSTWIVRKTAPKPRISCRFLKKDISVIITCLLRILVVKFPSLVSVADAQVGQEVNKERTVKILAELIENKPGEKKKGL